MATFRTKCLITSGIFIYITVIIQGSEPVGPPVQGNTRDPSKLPREIPSVLPCPRPEDIEPCTCTSDEDFNIQMDCSEVTSEDELKTVFDQQFPFINFRELKINYNQNLTTIRAGDLGNCSFAKVDIINSQLRTIEDLALINSHDTLEILDLYGNEHQVVLDISPFKRLSTLNLHGDALTVFPVLNSSILEELDLGGNQIETVPVEAIAGLPSLKSLYLYGNSISHLLSETFTNNPNLSLLHLAYNKLSTISYDAVKLYGPDSVLALHYNQITNISEGSFYGVTGRLEIEYNNLTEFDEEVWRPLLEEEVYLRVQNNPFGCGCDIAWLILNRTLLEQLYDIPHCHDGTSFYDLDPAIYEEMC